VEIAEATVNVKAKVMMKIPILSLFFGQSTWAAFAFSGLLMAGSLYGSILPADRMGPWARANVGVEGGVPNSSLMPTYRTLLPGEMNTGTINTYISQCPSGQVVQLPAGTFNIGGNITMKSGVVVRGAGATGTILQGGGISFGGSAFYNAIRNGQYSGGGSASWTGGYSAGTTVITLSTTSPGLTPGNILFLDQANDNFIVRSSGYEGLFVGPRDGNHGLCQFTKVVSVNGNQVTISPPIAGPLFSGSLGPGAVWIGASSWISRAGVENLSVDGNTFGGIGIFQANIDMEATHDCWVKGVKSLNGHNDHINVAYGFFRDEIRDSYCFSTQAAAQQSYGVGITWGSGLLIENNIFEKIVSAIVPAGSVSASVFAYNYCTNDYFCAGAFYLIAAMQPHANHSYMNLWEGNHIPKYESDFIHGSQSHQVVFRNRITGWEAYTCAGGPTANGLSCVAVAITNSFESSVGNILGTSGIYHNYQSLANARVGQPVIYEVGTENQAYGKGWGDDNFTRDTFFKHMDWDVVHSAVFFNPTNADVNLPDSLYLTSKPAFFGVLAWPPYNPLNGASIAANPSSMTNIPAGYRRVFGFDPPSGPPNLPPIAVIRASTNSAPTNTLISFSSNGSSDPEGVSLSYSWSFGDGGTSTAPNPSHAYATNGNFNVQLNVSDGVNTASTNLTIRVTLVGVNLPPTAVGAATPQGGVAPLSVNFSSNGSFDPEGAPLTYSWAFGDGSTSTAASPGHTYQASGVHVAQLTVSDGTNIVAATPITITVGNGASGLVAAYGFEEGNGANVADVSGNGNNGVLNGATWTTGKFGKALAFNGTGSLVSVNDSGSLDLTTGMTLEAWVYPTALSSSWSDIIYKSPDTYFLMGTTPQALAPDMGGTFASTNVYGTVLSLNTWSHLAATYDGAAMRFYLNGVQVSSRPQTGAIATSAGALSLGGDAGGQYWAGLIDEVRIYNRALNQTEIGADMNNPVSLNLTKPPPPSALRFALQ
jgi:PKD repeat protein